MPSWLTHGAHALRLHHVMDGPNGSMVYGTSSAALIGPAVVAILAVEFFLAATRVPGLREERSCVFSHRKVRVRGGLIASLIRTSLRACRSAHTPLGPR
jgi:hypothetical protein